MAAATIMKENSNTQETSDQPTVYRTYHAVDLMESLDAVKLEAELAGFGRQLLAHAIVGKICCLLAVGVNKDVSLWLE